MRLLALALLTLPFSASAFCGFYVSGAGGKLFNDASMVVLLRDGARTVLSMQNNYRGPAEDFALVVPVPVILAKENVKTIPRAAFTRVDELTSPRLVEMPKETCPVGIGSIGTRGRGGGTGGYGSGVGGSLGVKVEAKFNVEEYEIVILSAKFSLGLETWLKENRYQIPEGAAAALQPYVQSGSKFFVARVDAKKAKFETVKDASGQEKSQLVLSPLRFHYDSETFSLPVRLGLLNSSGTQDLIVHVVAKDRYELANGKNVFVPTNIDVSERARAQFGGFYKELLARTFKKHPGAAVTEFAWKGALPPPKQMVSSGIYGVTCDPCPPPHPVDDPLARYLGVELLPNIKTDEQVAAFTQESTLTRLHLRYAKDSAPDDLVFKVAPAVHGGIPDVKGAMTSQTNRFQGRYLMWVDGCGAGTSAFGRMFSPPALTVGTQTTATELVDAFEQVITSDIHELNLKPMPLPKEPRPLPEPPPAPKPDWGVQQPQGTAIAYDTPEVQGRYDPELLKKVVHANRGQLRYCYELALTTNPALAGRVVFSFEISPGGVVTASSIATATLPDEAAKACMAGRVRTWIFPKPRDGTVKVKMGVSFSQK
ncbi:MAG: DUF2330 domain-containing protein [Archangium sp.]|nr:DUF2330 domain-containing protein [Archangium sp.]